MAIKPTDEMTKEEIKTRKVEGYPPEYLKKKAVAYTTKKEISMSVFIGDLMREFFSGHKNNLVQ